MLACFFLWIAASTQTSSASLNRFGRFDHEDWCCHSSSVCLWRLFRRQHNSKAGSDGAVPVTKADIVLESNACVMCLDFHPTEPSLLAGGNFQGDLLIWDIARIDTQMGGDALLTNSNVITMRSDVKEDGDSGGHKEAISQVPNCWSTKILVWKFGWKFPIFPNFLHVYVFLT